MAEIKNSPATSKGGNAADNHDLLAPAAAALFNRQPQDAERIAAEVLRIDPRHVYALYVLGCALMMQGRNAEAIMPLETAAVMCDDPKIDTALGTALRLVERHEEAASRLRAVAERKPHHAPAFLELGYLLIQMGHYNESVDILSRGLDIAPTMPELSVQLGYAQLSRRDCENAKTAFSKALEISPSAPDALFGMAKAHQELGQVEDAAAYFRLYLTPRPNDAAALLNLGHCLLELGQLDEGHECFRRAARGDDGRYGNALLSLAAAARGRFWLRPSDAARFLRRPQS